MTLRIYCVCTCTPDCQFYKITVNFTKLLSILQNYCQFYKITVNFTKLLSILQNYCQFYKITVNFTKLLSILQNYCQFYKITVNFTKLLKVSRISIASCTPFFGCAVSLLGKGKVRWTVRQQAMTHTETSPIESVCTAAEQRDQNGLHG